MTNLFFPLCLGNSDVMNRLTTLTIAYGESMRAFVDVGYST